MSEIDKGKWIEFIKDSEGYTIEAGGAFIEELKAKSAFSLWLDYCEMKEQLSEQSALLDEAVKLLKICRTEAIHIETEGFINDFLSKLNKE